MTSSQQTSVSILLFLLFVMFSASAVTRMSQVDMRGELQSMGLIVQRGVIHRDDRLVIIPARKPYIPDGDVSGD